MESIKHIFIGVDVSKDELVVAYPKDGKWIKSSIVNKVEPIAQWLSTIDLSDKHVVLEATGPYSERLMQTLAGQGVVFSVVNPTVSRSMSKVLGKSNKNDDQDAQTLSVLGQKMDLKPYEMPDAKQKSRKEALSALTSLQKQEHQLKNQLHAFDYRVNPNPKAVKALEDVLKSVQQAIDELQEELCPQQDEHKAQELTERISSINGVGPITARAFVAVFGDFQWMTSAKAFAKFLGLTPTEYTSGTSVRGRRSITKNGSSKLRSLLFNCARSAIRYNPLCKQLYERLVEKDKNGKVALTAVMHKLARIIYGVVRSGQNFDISYAIQKQKVVKILTT